MEKDLTPSTNGGKDPINGRFLPKNRIGTGNPRCKDVAKIRKQLFETIGRKDFEEIKNALIVKCKEGSAKHIELLFSWILGKPEQHIVLTQPDKLSPDDAVSKIFLALGITMTQETPKDPKEPL